MESSLSHFSLIYSLLWPRGYYLRERVLDSYNPYVQLPSSDPRLLRDAFARRVSYIDVDTGDWPEHLSEQLATSGLARLRSASKLQATAVHSRNADDACRDRLYLRLCPTSPVQGAQKVVPYVLLHIREAACSVGAQTGSSAAERPNQGCQTCCNHCCRQSFWHQAVAFGLCHPGSVTYRSLRTRLVSSPASCQSGNSRL